MEENKGYQVSLSEKEVEGIKEKIQFLEVNIFGTVSLGKMMDLMREIKKITETIKGRYISVTDMRNLEVGKLLQSIILYGMESSYVSLLAVKNQALFSFVLFDQTQIGTSALKEHLLSINEQNKSGKRKYNYIFARTMEGVFQILKENYPK